MTDFQDKQDIIASQTKVTAAEVAELVARNASDTAEQVTKTAEKVAETLKHSKQQQQENLEEALRSIFGEDSERQRFINISKIPLICKDISKIKDDVVDLKIRQSYYAGGIIVAGALAQYIVSHILK